MVLSVMTHSRLVGGYKCFEGTRHLTPDMPREVSDNQSHNPEVHEKKVGSNSNALFSTCILELLGSNGARGGLVVKALRYKPAGRGFDSRWCH